MGSGQSPLLSTPYRLPLLIVTLTLLWVRLYIRNCFNSPLPAKQGVWSFASLNLSSDDFGLLPEGTYPLEIFDRFGSPLLSLRPTTASFILLRLSSSWDSPQTIDMATTLSLGGKTNLSTRGQRALHRPPLLKCALFENQFCPETHVNGLINLGVAENVSFPDFLRYTPSRSGSHN